jgi:hypothetical protein
MRRLSWGALFAALALAGTGCGKNDLTKVQGIATLDGKPIENALITFVPGQAGSGKIATGRTGPDGSFQLTTMTPNDGAFPGEYLVTVQYEEGYEVPPGGNMKEAKAAAVKVRQQKTKKAPKYVVPAQYSDAGKTPLKQKVPPDGTVKLELQSK